VKSGFLVKYNIVYILLYFFFNIPGTVWCKQFELSTQIHVEMSRGPDCSSHFIISVKSPLNYLQWTSKTYLKNYFKVVHSVHFLDQSIQFILPTKCTLLVTYEC
jgi:hypothetical protein